jgi:HEAT repeat protein
LFFRPPDNGKLDHEAPKAPDSVLHSGQIDNRSHANYFADIPIHMNTSFERRDIRNQARIRAEPRVVVLSLFLIVIGGGLAFAQQGGSSNSPVSAVVADLYYKNPKETREAASQALVKLGTNALPYLLEEVRALGKLQDADLTNFDLTPELRVRQFNVSFAFKTLGPIAKPAVPELTNLLDQGKGPLVAADALSWIDGSVAASAFTHALTNRDLRVRIAGASRLGGLDNGIDANLAVPPLIECLNYESSDSSAPWLRAYAAMALGHIHAKPDPVVPALLKRLSEEKNVQTPPNCKVWIIQALGRFGSDARSAIPALEKAAKDPDPIVSRAATQSLKQIGG